MTDFESAKAKVNATVELFLRNRADHPARGLFDNWVDALSRTEFSALGFSFDPRDLHGHYPPDEVVFSSTFHLFEPAYLRQCCSPGADCLAGKRCIPIGSVDGADGFVYISEDSELGIAHLHHDDVYTASDLDGVVTDNSSRLELPLQTFFNLLRPPTNLAKLAPRLDGSKWLVVEDLGTKVRYEIHLSDEWDVGERQFHTPHESEEFFFELIRRGCATSRLSLLYCSPHLEQRVEAMLNLSPISSDRSDATDRIDPLPHSERL